MKSPLSRSVAAGVLLVGVALIVWTAVGDPDDEPGVTETASTPTVVPRADPSDAPTTTATVEAAALDTATSVTAAPTSTTTTTEALEPIPVLGTAFTLSKLDGWLNTEATSLEEIRAQNTLTVVQFWTFGCRNCKKTLDALGQLHADFSDRGVEIVGVHAPEFAYEADVDNIIEAAAELGVVWPIALDTTKYNFHVWQEGPTGYWPRVYIIDGDNQIRFDRRGDGAHTYRELYATVERLLAET
ncbi:redoxin domain-containing protein [Candidatus Poriferisodalis sp.]|uniref:redoxin domain-containing protein n=1 Tax=Candidatus Poriferisodalis sp. TaxID=3101277 RepID=UPI003B0279E7